MANTIALRKAYSTMLDEVYKLASLTAVLDGPNELVREGANANEILIPKMSMQGLANYNKQTGYVAGDVTLEYETKNVDMIVAECLPLTQWTILRLQVLRLEDCPESSFVPKWFRSLMLTVLLAMRPLQE